MALTSNTSPETENQSNKSIQTAEDCLCWRCGQPDSEHSWYGGRTCCDPDVDEYGDPIFRDEIHLHPPQMTDEELVRRMTFVQNVRDWTL